jgi:hypothetical protein
VGKGGGTTALTHGDGGELKQRRWHATSDCEWRRGARTRREVGDGLGRQRSAAFRPALLASDTGAATGQRFTARARARPCRPNAARGTLGGGSALTSGSGAEREKLAGGKILEGRRCNCEQHL